MRATTRASRILAGALLAGLMAFAGPLHAAPPPLEAYGALPKTEAVALSPDGLKIASVGNAGDNRLLLVQTTEGKMLKAAKVGALKLLGLEWAGNDFVILYLHLTARLNVFSPEQEFAEGVVVNLKDGSVRPLVRSSPEYLPAVIGNYGFAQQDGHWFAYLGLVPTEPARGGGAETGGYFKQRYPDLYRVDLETGGVQRVTRGTTHSRSWVVDTGGQIIAESEYDPNSGDWKVFLPGSPEHPVASGRSPFSFSLAGLSRTPGTVLVRQGGVDGDVVELHLDTGRTEIFLPAGKPAQLIHSLSTRQLIGALMGDDALLFDPVLDRHYKSLIKAYQGHTWNLISVSSDFTRMVTFVTGGDTAGTWNLVDFSKGRSDPIADDYPGVPDAMLGKVRMINYRAADGLQLQGVLTLPPGIPPRNLPLVVLPHGGPEDRDHARFGWWPQAFASRGYAVFQPNFRGSSGYGMAFRNAGFGQWGRKMQTDISDGVAALAVQGIVDPHRACIVGASYGGYAALAGVTVQHGLYRCAASYGGLGDMHDILYSTKAQDRNSSEHYADVAMRYWLSYLGATSPDDAVLDTISPRILAKDADAPILLIYGEKDTVVPPDQSKDMASALKRAGKPVEIVELDGEDHWLSRSETRLQMLKAMVAFVEKYNPADPPPDK